MATPGEYVLRLEFEDSRGEVCAFLIPFEAPSDTAADELVSDAEAQWGYTASKTTTRVPTT